MRILFTKWWHMLAELDTGYGKTNHERNGITKAAISLLSQAPPPRHFATLEVLCCTYRSKGADTIVAYEKATLAEPQASTPPREVQGTITKVEEPRSAKDPWAAIKPLASEAHHARLICAPSISRIQNGETRRYS